MATFAVKHVSYYVVIIKCVYLATIFDNISSASLGSPFACQFSHSLKTAQIIITIIVVIRFIRDRDENAFKCISTVFLYWK